MHYNLIPPALATLLFILLPQYSAGFKIDVKPETVDGNYHVLQNISTNINPSRDDPPLVDIFLFDGAVGKETPLLSGARLEREGTNFTIKLPKVPPGYPFSIRVKQVDSPQPLQDSSPFPILPTLDGVLTSSIAESSVVPITTPSSGAGTDSVASTAGVSAASMTVSTAGASSMPMDDDDSSPPGPPPRPISAIVGPLSGLFLFSLFVGVFLCLRRRRIKKRKAKHQQTLANMQNATRSVAKQPYVTIPSTSSSDLSKDLEAGSYTMSSESKGASSSKSRRLSYNSLFPESSSSSSSSQPEVLKRERARVYKEIAALERRSESLQSPSNPFADPAPDITTRDILQQLTALKMRIRELEELHAHEQSRARPSSGSSADPPPEYIPAHHPDHTAYGHNPPEHDGNSKTQCFCASCT